MDCWAVIGEKRLIWSSFCRDVIQLNDGASEETLNGLGFKQKDQCAVLLTFDH